MHTPHTPDATASNLVGALAPSASLPPAVNFHLWKPCNLRCTYCFATFHDDARLQAVKGGASESDCLLILDQLRAAGVEKINFVGGEPTLCPHLPSLLEHSRALGLVVSIVSNGARLAAVLDKAPGCVDWVGLSVDSADEVIQAALGRGRGYVAKSLATFALLHQLGIRCKLNTVVTSLNWQEDMTNFVLQARPERWKVFQVLPVAGQNDGKVEPLLITPTQFEQ
ncbi:MAG: viperin family antiviral radical SAM protein, partial [Phycisphaerae bacterium]|nr:viperin family antiviral radical SAM protein [Phycisphaerae bacterium]